MTKEEARQILLNRCWVEEGAVEGLLSFTGSHGVDWAPG